MPSLRLHNIVGRSGLQRASGAVRTPRTRARNAASPLVYLLLLLAAPAVGSPATAQESARVKQVYDGDTILLEDGRKVRYLGINAPEYREPFYLKAKRFNESLVLNREIRLEFDQERADAYGRLLAYVYVGDQLVNARIVHEGLAHAFFIGPVRKHDALFLETQEQARRRRAGIWSSGGDKKTVKITSVYRADPDQPDGPASYVRIANLSSKEVRLAGYTLSNESGQRYVFPDVTIEDPGYTLIVSGATGGNGKSGNTQRTVHWPGMAWDREDTAYLIDRSGAIVDSFRYKERKTKDQPKNKKSPPAQASPPIHD